MIYFYFAKVQIIFYKLDFSHVNCLLNSNNLYAEKISILA